MLPWCVFVQPETGNQAKNQNSAPNEVDPDGSGPSESSLDDLLHLIEEEQMVFTACQYQHPPFPSTRDRIGTKMMA